MSFRFFFLKKKTRQLLLGQTDNIQVTVRDLSGLMRLDQCIENWNAIHAASRFLSDGHAVIN